MHPLKDDGIDVRGSMISKSIPVLVYLLILLKAVIRANQATMAALIGYVTACSSGEVLQYTYQCFSESLPVTLAATAVFLHWFPPHNTARIFSQSRAHNGRFLHGSQTSDVVIQKSLKTWQGATS